MAVSHVRGAAVTDLPLRSLPPGRATVALETTLGITGGNMSGCRIAVAFAFVGSLLAGRPIHTAAQASTAPVGGTYAQEARITALEAQMAALGPVLELIQTGRMEVTTNEQGITALRLTGINLQVVNGVPSDNRSANGTGNVIIGYNEERTTGAPTCSLGEVADEPTCLSRGGTWAVSHKSGSHYLVIGREHNYSRHHGIVAGYRNTASGPVSIVLGGMENTAFGVRATVLGGQGNTASGQQSAVSGGSGNIASGQFASVSGGRLNKASEEVSAVSGGFKNNASGWASSVSGGALNTASGDNATVSGGRSNTASGGAASVSGGILNTASELVSAVSGGFQNNASGWGASVSGGARGIASGSTASASGGDGNNAFGDYASVCGGGGNAAVNSYSSILGGQGKSTTQDYQTIWDWTQQ